MMITKQLLPLCLLLLSTMSTTTAANPLKKIFGDKNTKEAQRKVMEEAAGASGNTCDGALAKSLVHANEMQAKSDAERDAVQEENTKLNARMTKVLADYANTKTTLDDRIAQLESDVMLITAEAKDRLEKRQRELDDYVGQSEEAAKKTKAKHEEALRQTQAWWLAKTEDMNNEYASKEEEFTKEATEHAEKLKADLTGQIETLTATIATLREENAKTVAELTAEAATNISRTEQELMSKHDKKHEELEAIKKKSEEERLALLREKEEHATMLMSDLDLNKKTLEEQHNSVVEELKVEMATKEKNAMDVVRAKEVELETKMEGIKKEAEKQLEESKGQHSKEMTALMASIKAMEKDHDDLEQKMGDMESRYASAAKEIDEWQQLYSARSYCNVTYMQEDATATLSAATKVAAEQITVASKVATEQLSVAGTQAIKAAEPHLQKGRALYDLHLKEHVDKHVLPIHESHVKPVLAQASQHVAVATTEAQNYVDAAYQQIVLEFQSACPNLKLYIRNADLHPVVLSFVKDKCSDPQATVDRVLITALALFVFIFRRFLWRSLLAVLYFPFYLMWYMTPLPLLFPNSKRAKKIKSEQLNVETDDSEMEESLTPTAAAPTKIKKEKMGHPQ